MFIRPRSCRSPRLKHSRGVTCQNTIWFVLLATGCAVFVVVLRRARQQLRPSPRTGSPVELCGSGFFLAKSASAAGDRGPRVLVPGALDLGLGGRFGLPAGGRVFDLAVPAAGDCRAVVVGPRSAEALPHLPAAPGIARRDRAYRFGAAELGGNRDGLLRRTRRVVSARVTRQCAGSRSLEHFGRFVVELVPRRLIQPVRCSALG